MTIMFCLRIQKGEDKVKVAWICGLYHHHSGEESSASSPWGRRTSVGAAGNRTLIPLPAAIQRRGFSGSDEYNWPEGDTGEE
jgi:hypothetical protein